MLLRKFFTLLLSSFLLINLNAFSQIKEVIKVSGTLIDFNKAAGKKDGADATKYVSESTKIFMTSIFAYVKNKTNASNDSAFIANKVAILWLNKMLANEYIENIQADQFLSFIISNGTFQKLQLDRFHAGGITMNGETAKALLTTFSSDEKTECQFIKEGKKWKIKLESVVNYLVNSFK